jgi:hypothetical protein
MTMLSTRSFAGLLAAGLLALPASAQQTAPAKGATATATLPSAMTIIEKADKAMGTAVAGTFKNRVIKQQMTMAAQGMTVDITTYSEGTDKLLIDSAIMGMSMKQGYDGVTGWAVDPMQGPRLLTAAETEQMRSGPENGGSLLEAYPTVKTVGEESFNGADCWKVSMISDLGTETFGFFDQSSHVMVGMAGKQKGPMGEIPYTAKLSDYADHHGMLLPGTMTFTAMGAEQVVKLLSVQVNVADMPSFSPPPEVAALAKGKP